jgi:pimeloyl-ACP methyl ester carboxylesterase
MIAALAASQSPDIAFMVLIASPGLTIKKMEFSERARTLKANGAASDLIARSRALQNSLFTVINQETNSKAVQNEFTAIITAFFKGISAEERKITGLSDDNLEAYIQDQFQRLHSPWFRFYLPYDPGNALQKVTCPVLAINGDKDVQVISQENLAAIEKALLIGGNKDFTVKELSSLNHLLQTAETGSISEYSKIEETMSPAALKLIGDWILSQRRD